MVERCLVGLVNKDNVPSTVNISVESREERQRKGRVLVHG